MSDPDVLAAYDALERGDVIRVHCGFDDRGMRGPFHVRGRVDGRIVFRWYGEHKQWWHYRIEDRSWWEIVVGDRAVVTRGKRGVFRGSKADKTGTEHDHD